MTIYKNNPFAPFVCLEPITTLDGHQIVCVKTEDHQGFVPAIQFGNRGSAAFKTLERFNIAPLPDSQTKMMAAVAKITEFREGNYIARPGSVPPYYALQDGSVFRPESVAPAEAIFPKAERGLSQAGTLKDWLQFVAKPLSGNPRAQMLLALPMAAIVAELCDGASNVGIEIVGPPATGKSTGLMCAASVVGGAVDRETSYMVSMNATSNGLEGIVPMFRNALLVLEEGQLFSASDTPKARATKWRELGHRLSDGSSKLRGKSGDTDAVESPTSTPLWFLLNSNEPLAEVLGGGDTDADRAVLQRIQTLPANGRYGLFDKLPEGVRGGAPFSDSLQAAMRRNHGTAIRKFLQEWVELRYRDEDALKQRIALHMRAFEEEINLDQDDGEHLARPRFLG